MVDIPRAETFERASEPVPAASQTVDAWSRRHYFKSALMALALLAGLAAAGYYGYKYWTVGQYLESTDDAYIKADYTIVAPKVAGYIADVLVRDNESVKAGQVVARIHDRDFRAALAQTRADVEAAEASIRNFDAQIFMQNSIIEQASATIAATQASLTFAEADAARYRELSKTGFGTTQRAQRTEAARGEAAAQLRRDRAALVAAKASILVLTTARDQARAHRDRSLAVAQQADLNLSYTTIVAPVDGEVGARTLRVGQYVTAGTQLMAVTPLEGVYVVANFKETQLAHVRGGQRVDVKVDSYSGVTLKGRVDSLAPATGLEFALLPPDNATGNFTKIVQRIPVRIVLDDATLRGDLRAGMSVEATIDTKAEATRQGDAKEQIRLLSAGE